jgi:hypothetical protein
VLSVRWALDERRPAKNCANGVRKEQEKQRGPSDLRGGAAPLEVDCSIFRSKLSALAGFGRRTRVNANRGLTGRAEGVADRRASLPPFRLARMEHKTVSQSAISQSPFAPIRLVRMVRKTEICDCSLCCEWAT